MWRANSHKSKVVQDFFPSLKMPRMTVQNSEEPCCLLKDTLKSIPALKQNWSQKTKVRTCIGSQTLDGSQQHLKWLFSGSSLCYYSIFKIFPLYMITLLCTIISCRILHPVPLFRSILLFRTSEYRHRPGLHFQCTKYLVSCFTQVNCLSSHIRQALTFNGHFWSTN